VRGTWDDGARISIADAEETLEAIALLAGSRPLPLLADMRGIQTLDRDARRRFSESDVVTRLVFLVDSPLTAVY